MGDVAFVDTNVIDNANDFRRLFGGRSDMESMATSYSIVVPKIVFDELVEHKREEFEKQKLQVQKTPLLAISKTDLSKALELSFDAVLERMCSEETIEYELFTPRDYDSFVERYSALAVAHKPPFSPSSDKGFKDALLAFSIEEYLSENAHCHSVSLVTADKRLMEYFRDNDRVEVFDKISNLPKIRHQSDDTIVQSSSSQPGGAGDEVVASETRQSLEQAVEALCGSCSFASTHAAVETICSHQRLLTDEEKRRILRAAVANNQITWLLQDPDVRELILPIFNKFQEALSDREYSTFVDAAGIPNNRLDEDGNVRFSRSERSAYLRFSENLIKHISSRSYYSSIRNDAEDLAKRLKQLIAKATLEPNSLSWQAISEQFVNGNVYADDSSADITEVEDFVELLTSSSKQKQNAIISSIATRFEMIDCIDDIPF